jgi:membrane associated rhomboid family serine protease
MRSFGGGGGSGLPSLETMASKLAVALVAGSVLYHLTKGGQGALLLLWPDFVLGRLFLWQPLTYAFTESSPLGIIFGAIITWSIGGYLESIWGGRRLLLVAVGITALAGFITVLLAMLNPYATHSTLVITLPPVYACAVAPGTSIASSTVMKPASAVMPTATSSRRLPPQIDSR